MNELFWEHVDFVFTANDNQILIVKTRRSYFCFSVPDAFGKQVKFKEIENLEKFKGLVVGVEFKYKPNQIVIKMESGAVIIVKFTPDDINTLFNKLCYYLPYAVADHDEMIINTTNSLEKIPTIRIL